MGDPRVTELLNDDQEVCSRCGNWRWVTVYTPARSNVTGKRIGTHGISQPCPACTPALDLNRDSHRQEQA